MKKRCKFCPICGEMVDEFDLEAVMRHVAEGHRVEGLRPMREFDPDRPAAVHDRLNDEMLEWGADQIRRR